MGMIGYLISPFTEVCMYCHGRWRHATEGIDDTLYLAGGYVSDVQSSMLQTFDTSTNTWSLGPPMVTLHLVYNSSTLC